MAENTNKTDQEIEDVINLENARIADGVQEMAEQLANEGGILLAEEQGIAAEERKISEHAKLIAEQNDIFRRSTVDAVALAQSKTLGLRGQTLTTQGVQALGVFEMMDLLVKVGEYDDFKEENNPRGERDMGFLKFQGENIIWKIDYFANDMEHGSEDPTDLAQTVRVMIVMLASEY